MKREFEVVSQETFRYLHVFLVNLASRTPHIHKEIELGLVLKGKLTVREGKNAWNLDRDEMYLINSMEAHEFVADDPDTLILAIQISPRMLMPFLSDAALLRFQEKRFEHALSLFENTDGTILEITVESGFSDERYLTKLFHERMGCSPKEYRKKQSQTQSSPRNAVMNTQKIFNDEEAIAFLGHPAEPIFMAD